MIDIICGALLGVLFTFIFQFIYKKIVIYLSSKKDRQLKRDKALRRNYSKIYHWLLEYYKDKEGLYLCNIGNAELKIPFLSKSDWLFNTKIDLSIKHDALLDIKRANNEFDIDNKIIKSRVKQGDMVFGDSFALYLDDICETDGKFQLKVKICKYYEILSNILSLENETFSAIDKNRYDNLTIRDSYIKDLYIAQGLFKKPFSVGCATLLALKTDGDIFILLHKRSDTLPTYPSSMGTIPNYGLVPINMGETILFKEYNTFLYNFLKEYLEELFNYEELIDESKNQRVNPMWFYENSKECKDVLNAVDGGTIEMRLLGFGFDCLNGVPILGCLCIVEDETIISDIKYNAKLNWEGDSVRWISIDKDIDVIEKYLLDYKFHPGAAFTISESLKILGKRKNHNDSFHPTALTRRE